jgi:hypothetical protein
MESELSARYIGFVNKMYERHSYDIKGVRVEPRLPAMARTVIKGREVTVLVHPTFLNLSKENQDGILKHEAIHLAYPRHDQGFRMMADAYGAPYSYADVLKLPWEVYAKKDGKEKLGEFKTYREAEEFSKNIIKMEQKQSTGIKSLTIRQTLPKAEKAKFGRRSLASKPPRRKLASMLLSDY